jgi:hypothetical protein
MGGYGVLPPEGYGGQQVAAAVALGAQLVEQYERLAWARVGAPVERPAASVVRKQSRSVAEPPLGRMVTAGQAAAYGVRSGLAGVSLLTAQALASARTPALQVAVAAARQCAALKVGARMPEVAMAEGTMGGARRAEAKLAEAKLFEAAMAEARMPKVAMARGTMGGARRAEAKLAEARILEAALAGPRMPEARRAEAKMTAPAATVPDWNLPA